MHQEYHFEDDVPDKSYSTTTFNRLLRLLRPYTGLLIITTAFLLITSALSNTIPFLNMMAIDKYINNPQRFLISNSAQVDTQALNKTKTNDIKGLTHLLYILAILLVIQTTLRYIHSVLLAYIGQKITFDMRMTLFRHIQALPVQFLDRNPIGRLMTRLTNDIEKIQQTIVTGVVQSLGDLSTIIIILIFMFLINWVLALLTLSMVPLILLVTLVFKKQARKSYLEIAKKIAQLNAYLQESITGIRIIQLFCSENNAFKKYEMRNAEHRDEWFQQIKNFALYFPTIEFLSSVSIGLIILYIGTKILRLGIDQVHLVSLGSLFAYIQWAERVYGPIRGLADRYNMLLEASASSERIFALLDTPGEEPDPPDAMPIPQNISSIEFDHVWFAYDDERWVLKDVSFKIQGGEQIAIVGPTGSGKTTLANLLCRFYEPQQGFIRINGVDIRQYQRNSLRSTIGMVSQDVFLFSGSIKKNILLGSPNLPEETLLYHAELVNAMNFIEKLPNGFEHPVGERGCNLSTGQRQLICFARALAYNPSILILDEATSSVDAETEFFIRDAIQKLLKNRTSIIIAHRLSTIQHATRIIVLHQGEIKESGSHNELLQKGGLYYKLYKLQFESIKTKQVFKE